MKKVIIVMGSDSDLPIAEKAVNVLKEFEVPFEVRHLSWCYLTEANDLCTRCLPPKDRWGGGNGPEGAFPDSGVPVPGSPHPGSDC